MASPTRVTIALDKETAELFEKLKEAEKASQSGLIRRALKFYSEFKDTLKEGGKKVDTYVEMLSEGEHIILDVDHWILFLKFLEESGRKEEFFKAHRDIARSHGEHLPARVPTVEDLLRRLEICNFYKINKASDREYTLILGNEKSKDFLKIFLEEVAAGLGFDITVKEDYAKLRVTVNE